MEDSINCCTKIVHGMRDGDKKQWDADFHKKGAGMRDQDPPAPPAPRPLLQTLLP